MNEKGNVLKREAVLLFALIICAAVFRLFLADMPLDSNEGLSAAAASASAGGSVLYRDVFTPEPPFSVYLYKLAFQLSGESDMALRIFSTGFFAFCIVLLFITVRTLWGRSAAVFACLIYLFAQNNPALYALNASSEFFGQFPALLVFLFMLDADEEYAKVNFFLAGFFAGVAALCWYGYAMLFFPVLIAALFSGRKGVINALMSFAGFALMYLLAVLWAVRQGNIAGFADTLSYTLSFVKSLTWQGYGAVFAANLKIFIFALPLTAFALIYGFFRKEPESGKNSAVMVSFSFLSLLYYVFLLKGVEIRYFIPLIPAAAILGGVMISALFNFISEKSGNTIASGVICLAVLGTACIYPFMKSDPERFIKSGGYLKTVNHDVRKAAALTGFRKGKSDTLLAWPDMAQAYFYAGVRPLKRHMTANTYKYFQKESEEILPLILKGSYSHIILRAGPAAEYIMPILEQDYEKTGDENGIVSFRKKGG